VRCDGGISDRYASDAVDTAGSACTTLVDVDAPPPDDDDEDDTPDDVPSPRPSPLVDVTGSPSMTCSGAAAFAPPLATVAPNGAARSGTGSARPLPFLSRMRAVPGIGRDETAAVVSEEPSDGVAAMVAAVLRVRFACGVADVLALIVVRDARSSDEGSFAVAIRAGRPQSQAEA